MKNQKPLKSSNLPNLGVLRAFLALTVVILHIPLMTKNLNLPSFNEWSILNRGYHAVWGFFTLSGFLIIRLLFIERSTTSDVNVKSFYTRRILRIYPVYYLILLIGLIFYHYILPLLHIKFETNYTLFEALAWCIALMPNVFFSMYDPGGILSVLWSIGIEEQFYLLIAPISKFVKSKFFTISLGIFTLLYFSIYFIPEFEILRKFRLMYFYFSFGGLVSILYYQGKLNWLINQSIIKYVSYLTFLIYFFTNAFEFNNEVLKHFISMLVFASFILFISSENKYKIENKFLNHLGNISYGIYMYHMIALYITIYLGSKLNVVSYLGQTGSILYYNVATILITLILSHFSYEYLEKRFLNLKTKYRKQSPIKELIHT
jgi:peptidoglycan/LPS O-acetylase OafA/YrhL